MNTLMKIKYNLGSASQIPPGEGREYNIAGRRIAVFHARNGQLYATQALCPHREGPLVDGLLGGSTLLCPLHAWKFELASGKAIMGDCDLLTYEVERSSLDEVLIAL